MKNFLCILGGVFVVTATALAQMGGGPGAGGGNFNNGMEKLFGDTPTFSATMLTSINGPSGLMTVKSKMSFDHESSRTEMNMSDVQGTNMPPDAAAQMKALGMDTVVTITTADKKNVYMVYPAIHSYVTIPVPPEATTNGDYSIQKTKLGDETVDGHPCVKNDVVMTNTMESHEFTVWTANDLKNFPVKIAMTDSGMSMSILFQNVSFDKPSSDLFQPPAHCTRYGNIQDLMQSAMMNRSGSMPGMQPAPPPPGQ